MGKDILHQLMTETHYRSPNRSPGWTAECFPGLYFYWKIAGVVLRASKYARRNQYSDERWIADSLQILKILENTGVRVSIDHMDRLRRLKSACVFIANHMSTLETFVLPCLIQPHRKSTFVVKQSLVEYPVFKHVMINLQPIVVTRENPREDLKTVLEQGIRRLREGISIIVFPQTTRHVDIHLSHFNTIGIKLAARAGVPALPVAVRTDAWGNGKWIKEFGRIHPEKPVHFSFGEPISVTGHGKQQHQTVVNYIKSRLSEWFAESPAASSEPPKASAL
ncbi:MAG TPA: 1-acyl-sn-glycerol-3-phosphate acyltransferase [bacterium]|nr:1-acyl-sn-glycerol-3-phosphate acyltransferase [bacterium]